MAHVLSRETFGKTLFEIYNGLGTNPDKNYSLVEKVMKQFGFTTDIVADPFGALILFDEVENKEIDRTS